jgi:two-component system, OmpR family, response regulator
MKECVRTKVLIIDDEPDICFLLTTILRKRNFETGFAYSLADAASVLELNMPNVIFLDNSLPDGKGVEFLPFIKNKYPLIKVVMVTANDSQADKTIAFDKGADIFLGKPLTREIINSALDSVMKPIR